MNQVPPPARLRLFIALPVPREIKTEIDGLQRDLRNQLPGDAIRWTAVEQVHLTLAFLGDVDSALVSALTIAVNGACAKFGPMRLRAERMGFFPHAQAPRVLWVWVHDDWGGLVRLQRAVALATKEFGNHHKEGSFTPHLTIGRISNPKHAPVDSLATSAFEVEGKVFGDWTADTVEIMQSELKGGSHHHRRLAAIPLQGNSPN